MKILILLLLFITISPLYSFENSTQATEKLSYDELFLVEKKDLVLNHQFELGYATITDNNLIDSSPLLLSYLYSFNYFFKAGTEVNYYNSELSQVGKNLANSASSNSTRQLVNLPTYSTFLIIEMTPFLNKSNFFNIWHTEARLNIKSSIGTTHYKNNNINGDSNVLSTFLELNYQLNITKEYFAKIFIRKTYDSPFNENARFNFTQVGVNIGMNFEI